MEGTLFHDFENGMEQGIGGAAKSFSIPNAGSPRSIDQGDALGRDHNG